MARTPPTQLKRDHNSAFVRWQGKRIYFGAWGARETSLAFAKWLGDVSGHPTAPTAKHLITVSACADRYLLHAMAYYPAGEAGNVGAAMASLVKFFGNEPAVDFGPKTLKDYQRAMAAAVKKDGITLKYARTTINARVDKIRRCFRWCASEELIPVEVVTALETVSGIPKGRGLAKEPKKVLSVPAEVVNATLDHLSPTVQAMVQIQYLCGMRPQDICGMTTANVDRTHAVWIYRPPQHKGTHRGQSLAKAIPVVAQAILGPLLRENLDEPIFSPLDTKEYFENAPKDKTRRFYTTGSYGKSIVYAIARAKKTGVTIPHWQPNQLRHSIATDLRRTVGIEAASSYLGHAKPDTTLIYAEQTELALRETAKGVVSPHKTSTDQQPHIESQPPQK